MNSPRLPYFIVDAFTDRPFAGNPAAVVPLDRWKDDKWLQNVAAEMNLSETAYLVPNDQGFNLRWFTPRIEVDLCGHATLASAKALSHLGQLNDGSEIAFSTRSGLLRAIRQGDKFQLDFPLTVEGKTELPLGLVESLGVSPRYVGRSKFDYLVEVESETLLRGLVPDFKRLASVECRGVIATARSDNPIFDFVSRFFAPAAGIEEDPVTGSAHCCLADFWGKRLGKTIMVGYQASSRGGIVHVEVREDRVMLGGEAVIVAQGELLTDDRR
jgi:predicted PhzF superfamily epimerase YddE/YHI9